MKSLTDEIKLTELRLEFLRSLNKLRTSQASAQEIARLHVNRKYAAVANHSTYISTLNKHNKTHEKGL